MVAVPPVRSPAPPSPGWRRRAERGVFTRPSRSPGSTRLGAPSQRDVATFGSGVRRLAPRAPLPVHSLLTGGLRPPVPRGVCPDRRSFRLRCPRRDTARPRVRRPASSRSGAPPPERVREAERRRRIGAPPPGIRPTMQGYGPPQGGTVSRRPPAPASAPPRLAIRPPGPAPGLWPSAAGLRAGNAARGSASHVALVVRRPVPRWARSSGQLSSAGYEGPDPPKRA